MAAKSEELARKRNDNTQDPTVHKPAPIVLALDMEGTLIDNWVRRNPRPDLDRFLRWAIKTFDRVVLMTCVPRKETFEILRGLEDRGVIRKGTSVKLSYIDWLVHSPPQPTQFDTKDLLFIRQEIPNIDVERSWIVDDDRSWMARDQLHRWVEIEDWYQDMTDDQEFERIINLLTPQVDNLRSTKE